MNRLSQRAAVPLLAVLLLAGCGTPPPSAIALLHDARQSFDNATTVHFHLTSADARSSSTYLVGGDGHAKRPSSFVGTLNVSIDGLIADVGIQSVAGAFFVKLPFSSKWAKANPTDYGFGDPAQLLDRTHGVTSLLDSATRVQMGDQDRYNGVLLYEVHCHLAGSAVAQLLTSADPSRDDVATIGIDVTTHQLRRVVITGPFFSTSHDSTYTLVLDDYDAAVTVPSPPG